MCMQFVGGVWSGHMLAKSILIAVSARFLGHSFSFNAHIEPQTLNPNATHYLAGLPRCDPHH